MKIDLDAMNGKCTVDSVPEKRIKYYKLLVLKEISSKNALYGQGLHPVCEN